MTETTSIGPAAIASENTPARPVPVTLFSIASGIIVANLFMAQPIALVMGASFGMNVSAAAQITTVSLLGYALGLLLVLPLIDLFDSRPLILSTMAISVCALALTAVAHSRTALLTGVTIVSVTSSTIQMLVAVAAQRSPEATRGRTIGTLMTGIMLGLLLSRPWGSLVAGEFGWRALYVLSAVTQLILLLCLSRALENSRPANPVPYFVSLASLWPLLSREPTLRRRAAYQGALMISFSAFWTAAAWRLAEAPFNLGTRGIALFSLAGAGGAVIAPLAGRAGDRGHTNRATLIAHVAVIVAVSLIAFAASDRAAAITSPGWAMLLLLAASAILLDMGCVADQALGRRAINLIRPEARGRMNGLFTASFFVGGAVGAALAGPAWSAYGWSGICGISLIAASVALVMRLTEGRVRE